MQRLSWNLCLLSLEYTFPLHPAYRQYSGIIIVVVIIPNAIVIVTFLFLSFITIIIVIFIFIFILFLSIGNAISSCLLYCLCLWGYYYLFSLLFLFFGYYHHQHHCFHCYFLFYYYNLTFWRMFRCIQSRGGLVIVDEVQTGLGRTGDHMWGFMHYEVTTFLFYKYELTMAVANGL